MFQISVLYVILFLFIGFAAGIFAGLLGIGGGVIFIPSLLFLLPHLGIEPSMVAKTAIATSLFAGTFASFTSFINHRKKENIIFSKGLILASGVLISASIAPNFIVLINPEILKIILAFFIFLVALKLLFSKSKKEIKKSDINKYWLFPMGLLFGGMAAMSGLGGGVFYVPLLIYFLDGDLKLSVGTSTMVVFISMVSASISFFILNHDWNPELFQIGYLNLSAALLLGLGAIGGAFVGVKLVFKVPVPIFRKIFAIFLLFVVIKIVQGL